MLYPKDPSARQASARRAEVDELGPSPNQFVLPLLPFDEGMNPVGLGFEQMSVPTEPDRGSDQNTRLTAPAMVEGHDEFENPGSRRKSPVRRQRLKSPVSVTEIKRILKAAAAGGLLVGTLEVKPDGTILVKAEPTADNDADDVFAKWADRL